MTEPVRSPWSVEQFLQWEAQQDDRYQYVDGLVLAMVGGTLDHNTMVGNLYAALRSACAGGPCRVFFESVKVLTEHGSFYPDVVVTCTEAAGKDDRAPDPVVIVEVLSRSTEEFDRGRKWLHYQTLASLQHYILVSQDEPRIDHYRRRDDGWDYTVVNGLDGAVELRRPPVVLPTREIFAGSSVTRA